MTAASLGPGPDLFSFLSSSTNSKTRRETFFLSLLGQAAILALIIYLTPYVILDAGTLVRNVSNFPQLPLIFSGRNGGGGGNFDPLPASNGNPPRASLETQIVPPTVIVPKEMPKLPVEQTVVIAPDVKFPEVGKIGDPLSPYTHWSSNGPGGPTGIGPGCCGGIGPSTGPGVGDGPPGIYPAGKMGTTIPQPIYSPEPSFSEEARKAKYQGIVVLLIVVGKDGHPYDIQVGQSLGMGLDQKAIDAVSRWRFRPATLNGEPVATKIAVQVDFHLY
ncbi:MAG TPA: TonB family protein [Candidatus Sulfotelmatobacter sp.]|nr:TonB family protein [Candidatus Sulfotelmatobacter sp.]